MPAASVNQRDLLLVENSPLYVPTTQGILPLRGGAGEVEHFRQAAANDQLVTELSLLQTRPGYNELASPISCLWQAVGPYDTLSKYITVREGILVRAPDHLSWEEAAAIPITASTAWNAIFCGFMVTEAGS